METQILWILLPVWVKGADTTSKLNLKPSCIAKPTVSLNNSVLGLTVIATATGMAEAKTTAGLC